MKKINLTDYIKKSGETLRLTDAERARMQHVVSEYMSVKPIRGNLAARRTPITTALLELYVFFRKSVAAALVLAILFSGAGVSYAAENALPGDVLYPLKVEVNEPVVAALSVSAEAKASWNVTRAERRLEEAEKLASENKLDTETKTKLLARFDEHAEAATEDIQKLEDSGSPSAIGLASDFETKLAAHETVLDDVDGKGETQTVKSRVRVKALALSKVREKAEGKVMVSAAEPVIAMALSAPLPEASVAPAALDARISAKVAVSDNSRSDETRGVRKDVVEKMAKSASVALSGVKKTYSRVESKLDQVTQARVTTQISAQAALVKTGDEFFASGDYAAAFRYYQEAIVGSGKLSVFLKAFLKLKIKTLPVERPTPQTFSIEPTSGNATTMQVPANLEIESATLPPPIQILPPDNPVPPQTEDDNSDSHSTNSGSSKEIEDVLKVRLGI